MKKIHFRSILIICFGILLTGTMGRIGAQTKNDSLAIKNTVKNFIEGWYEGDAKRMEASLHDEVVSKIVVPDENGDRLGHFTAARLVELTRNGGGTKVPENKQRKDIKILEIYQNIATARVLAYDAMEFLHLAKWKGEWKIMNILFERTKK